jgi:hypothetical protein
MKATTNNLENGKGGTMKDEQISEAMQEWAGLDNAPGSLTWPEWEQLTGRTAHELRTECDVEESTIYAAEQAGEVLNTAEDVIRLADRLWGEQIMQQYAKTEGGAL